MVGFGEFIKKTAQARLRKMSSPSKSGIAPGSPSTFILQEGDAVTVNATASTTGTVQQYNASGDLVRTSNITANTTTVFGAFAGVNRIIVTPTAGSIDAVVGDAVLGAATWDASANGGVGGLVAPGGAVARNPATIKNAGASVCDWQTSTGSIGLSAGVGAAAALDSTVTLFGKPTLKCAFSSAGTGGLPDTFIATFTLTNPVCLRDIKSLQIPLLFTSNQAANGGIGASGTPFQVWLETSDSKSIRAQCRFENLQSGAWTTLSFDRATAYITGTGNLASLDAVGVKVNSIKIVQSTNAAAASANPVWIGEIRSDVRIGKGRVSIVMDGEYSSQYTILKGLMSANGLRSSLAIVTSQIGTAGAMTIAQINEMYLAGHEVINHTYEAVPGTGATKTGGYGNAAQWPAAADISGDTRSQWAFMLTQGWVRGIGYGVWGYSYGFDIANSAARQTLVSAGLKSGGVIAMRKSVGYAGESNAGVIPPLFRMPVDPLVVCGSIQITNTHTAADVKACIDQAELTGQWVIITVHRAVVSAPGSLEMTTANFADWMAYLKARVDAGGVICSPFGETYNELMLTNQ